MIIRACTCNNRSALKCAFGEEYTKQYPCTIYSPPSHTMLIFYQQRVDNIDVPPSVMESGIIT